MIIVTAWCIKFGRWFLSIPDDKTFHSPLFKTQTAKLLYTPNQLHCVQNTVRSILTVSTILQTWYSLSNPRQSFPNCSDIFTITESSAFKDSSHIFFTKGIIVNFRVSEQNVTLLTLTVSSSLCSLLHGTSRIHTHSETHRKPPNVRSKFFWKINTHTHTHTQLPF